MGLFIMIGICILDIFMAVALFTFFIDALDNKFWRFFIYIMCATLIFNIIGILSIL